MRWLTLLTAFALLTGSQVSTQSTTADQTTPGVLATGISVPTITIDASKSFDDWLADTVNSESAQRNQRLIDWSAAPSARAAHPREEHLIPLMVAIGAAQADAGKRIYHEDDFMGGIVVSSFRFGAAAGDAA